MSYSVKSCVMTLQGEGARAGQAVILCRFSGCNLWSGRESDRKSALCRFCDTDFVGTDGPGGGRFDAEQLGLAALEMWNQSTDSRGARPYIVFTGGEPLLQLDDALIDQCHDRGFNVGIETNGTLPCPASVDWICVSPKTAELRVARGNELKLVYPHPGLEPEQFSHLEFVHWFLQPMDGPARAAHTRACVHYCLAHPRWRLSLQLHKLLGIP